MTKKLGIKSNYQKNLGLRKSLSKGALKDITNLQPSKGKKRKIRPGSAKSNSKTRLNNKKDSSFRSQNRSRSRDKSKQLKNRDNSQNKKVDDNILLK